MQSAFESSYTCGDRMRDEYLNLWAMLLLCFARAMFGRRFDIFPNMISRVVRALLAAFVASTATGPS